MLGVSYLTVQTIEISDMSSLIFQRLLFVSANKPTHKAKMAANKL
jgi:hypothetical protein